MLTCLRVEGDIAGAGLGEIGDNAIHRLDHEMHVDIRANAVLAQRLAHQRTDGQVRHVVIVHDIEVDHVGAGREHVVHLLAEPGEIGGENRWRNLVIPHSCFIPIRLRSDDTKIFLSRPTACLDALG